MQKFSRKYLKFWEKLRIAQSNASINPSKKNLKELALLKSISWSDSTRYTRSYLKEHKTEIVRARASYQVVPSFFNNF